MKDAFNEGLSNITHFIVFHPFLRRPQILLTFVRHLTLIKSNLIKKKKQKQNKQLSFSNKVQTNPHF